MIFYYLLLFATSLFTAVFSFLPKITTIPPIAGVDIDGQLSAGMAAFHAFAHAVWPIEDVWYGFLALLGYYFLIKMPLKVFLGNRAPGSH